MIKLLSHSAQSFIIPLRTPFRFGMVELRELQHLLIRATFDIDGAEVEGIAGENLAPKWFEKNPASSVEEDITRLRNAIDATITIAASLPPFDTPFDFWLYLHRAATQALPDWPPLVRQLGVSLMERCAIDVSCRRAGRPIHELLRAGLLGGVRSELVHPAGGPGLFDALPPAPADALSIRHTVGLSDDLQSLRAIRSQSGIRRLKIKLGGEVDADVQRVEAILNSVAGIHRITLDGNENYHSIAQLAAFLRALRSDARLAGARQVLAWIEQPLHRDVALCDEVKGLLEEYIEFPHVIDESDAELSSLPRALSLGYAGTTHKNCKGVFKSIIATMLLKQHEQKTGRRTIFSGEDLTIVAPWSQAQDLAVAAAVGVVDIERNGQHYADGLSAFPPQVGDAAIAAYPDLYERDDRGVVVMKIRNGSIDCQCATGKGFGCGVSVAI